MNRHMFRAPLWIGVVAIVAVGCSGDCGGTTGGDTAVDTSDTASEFDTDGGEVSCEPAEIPELTGESILSSGSFNQPIYVTQPPGESETLYVVERPGRVVRVRNGEIQSPPFLDIRQQVSTAGNERGLLGLAFHPNYQENGRFFVNYTPTTGLSHGYNVVAEFQRESEDPDVASSQEVRRLVERKDTESNHNGGMIAFGPDGHLYVGMGDGGGGCDSGSQHPPKGNGQTITNLFGALLRLDVDAAGRDFAAQGNPFVGKRGKDQIWAYGLRNPWRFSFDRKTGDLYIGDVGQNAIEEIDFQPASSDGGENYGWRAYEGSKLSSETASNCETENLTPIDDHVPPIHEYRHGSVQDVAIRGGGSVTGGYVYRGDAIPSLRGYYVYGDYESRDVAAFQYCGGRVLDNHRLDGLTGLGDGLASFGEDNAGELYLVYIASGEVFRLTAK